MTGALLKETIEDLEWPSGGLTVEAFLRRDPPLVTLSAHGAGDLRVTLPVSHHYPLPVMKSGSILAPRLDDTQSSQDCSLPGKQRFSHLWS